MKQIKQNALISVTILIVIFISIFLGTTKTYAVTLEPTEEQKIEYRAVQQKQVNGKNQLIVEVWIRNLDFKGIDLRLQHDTNLLNPSDLTNNGIIDVNHADGIPSNFEFCNNFGQYMDMFAKNQSPGELRMVYGLLGKEDRTGADSYLVSDEQIGDYIHITEPTLIGRMSFQVGEGEITKSALKLKTASTSPTTGIKVNINGEDNYQNQILFEFTLALESNDAYLEDIKLSTGTIEDDTYQKYEITPQFEKDTLAYQLELLEDIDKMNLTITKSHEKATIIMKIPKKDENGKLMYEADGTTILYEEKEITDSQNLTKELTEEITLNQLGEPDTIIDLKVIAEDGKTEKIYKVTIHRPYATIKGSIHTINSNDKHIADIEIYNSDKQIDWENLYGHDDLDLIPTVRNQKTNEDGTYEIKVIPGKYDVLIDKTAYLDYIVTQITAAENDEIDLGQVELIPGDVNKDGIVEGEDLTYINIYYDVMEGDSNYELAYDLNEDGIIEGEDLTYINIYYDTMKEVKQYER